MRTWTTSIQESGDTLSSNFAERRLIVDESSPPTSIVRKFNVKKGTQGPYNEYLTGEA